MIAHTVTTSITISTNQGKPNKKKKEKIEMIVIDETLIKDSVKEFNEENNILIKGDIILSSLMVLSLSFKNIWKIQNLQGLDRLERLQLDNNYIENIENLDHLVNLKWLDLSFNAIKEIKGLDNLKNLQDLSLFSNFITKIENLDCCPLLNVFSIGNNKLENYESLISTFRGSKFKHLQVLNVAGNPFTTKESDYKQHLIFNLINLKYLDYAFIDEQWRDSIKEEEKFRNQLSNQEMLTKAMALEEEEEKENQKKRKSMEESNMHLLEKFPEELATESELLRVKDFKGIEEEITKFKDKIKETTEALQKIIIMKSTAKIHDVDKFLAAQKQRERESENETIEILREFEHDKKICFRMQEAQKAGWKDKLIELNNKTMVTKDKLIHLEVILMDELDESRDEFQSKISKITQDMEKSVTACFSKIKEDYIKEFYKKISDLANLEADRRSQILAQQQATGNSGGTNELLQDDWNEDQLNLLENNDALKPTLGNIKENINGKADKREGEISKAINEDVTKFFKNAKERQYERNRKNITNIYNKINEYRKEIEEKLTGEDSESDKE